MYVVPAEDMTKQILDLIGGTKALMYSVLLVALVVSGLGLLNTILMATYERKKEFGYVRCVGAAPFHIIKLVLIETFLICAVGVTSGILAGWLFSTGVEGWIRQFLPYVPSGKLLRPDITSLFITFGVTFGLGILAGIYPSYRASQVSPMEAIRNE